jgi:DhnA family fructose-bisphosphate aldolase class Ia
MLNCNPETVSTDFDVMDRLYFEELTLERVLDVVEREAPDGVVVSVGGQTPNGLVTRLAAHGVKLLGSTAESIDEAVRLGADAVAVGCTLCGEHQAELLAQLGRVTGEAERAGMPTVTHIYPKGAGPEAQYSEEFVTYAARAASELNVDIVKTFYTGDPASYRRVVKACNSALVVSGGPKLPSMRDMFRMTFDAMAAGARGVTYGRNVWQSEDPVRVVRALKHIIHEGGTVDEAMEIAGTK